MRPQTIIKEQVREDIVPPAMVCRRRILSLFDNPMEGILGNLKGPPQCFYKTRNEEGAYLIGRWVVPIT